MEKKRILKSARVLIRQTGWALLVANVSLVIFVIIALVLSLFISNQVTVYALSFLFVAPFIINAYAKLFIIKKKKDTLEQGESIDGAGVSKLAKEKKVLTSTSEKITLLAYDFNLIARWIAYALFDGLLLVIWGYIQIVINNVISDYQSYELDYWLLVGIWLLFASATFLPILTHITLTTIRGLVDGWIAIKIELSRLEDNYSPKSLQNFE